MSTDQNASNCGRPLLEWTGHPLVDVGIATLCAMVDKHDPQELGLADLDRAADEMADYYFSGMMTSYNSCIFMNAYDNPTASAQWKANYEQRVLRAHRSPADEGAGLHRCPFSGQPATHLVDRGQMPMLTGRDVLNFFPAGTGMLPIAGPYLTSLRALPLGGRRVEGKLLIAHSDMPELTMVFARHYLLDNRRLLGLARAGRLPGKNGPSLELEREQGAWDTGKKRAKYPDAKAPSTLIVSDLMEVWRDLVSPTLRKTPVSITVYWLSSSGQGPSLEIFHLPAQVTRFLSLASTGTFGLRWQTIVTRGWRDPREKKDEAPSADEAAGDKKKLKSKPTASEVRVPGGPGRSRNDVLADLFAIYENGFINQHVAKVFLRRHLLRDTGSLLRALTAGQPITPMGKARETEDKIREAELIDWPLTDLFLKEVMGVDERHITAVRLFADRLADHVDRKNDRSLFRNVVYARRPWELRGALVKAQRNQAKEQNELLFGLEEFLEVFEADTAVGIGDWSLTRDLISIRLVEQLFARCSGARFLANFLKIFGKNKNCFFERHLNGVRHPVGRVP